MNVKQKRFRVTAFVTLFLYVGLMGILGTLLEEKDGRIFAISVLLFLLYCIVTTDAYEKISWLAREIHKEEQPRYVTVIIYGFEGDGRSLKAGHHFGAHVLIKKDGKIIPDTTRNIFQIETYKIKDSNLFGAPQWGKVSNDPNSIVMLGEVYTYKPIIKNSDPFTLATEGLTGPKTP